ncbi:MAG: YqgE/AlgH family protein [Candidatus Tectomicrobia bacterium]|uniref:UPF0301 protein HYZ11_13705 n=1 Tax=Tectimicrobiota bacterium TaxID=2528274 RepID=A0A932HZL9_UNCTE|nr:YqgE/AlgH family protein [Candidatus Tectomicrobia bacterium]
MRGASLLLAAALLLPGPLPGPGLRAQEPGVSPALPPPGSHQGELLIASPEMRDPRFREAVILLVRHNADGALGLILNRPLEEVPLAGLMQGLGVEGPGTEEGVLLHYGGPVRPGAGFVLHTAEEGFAPKEPLAPGYGVSPFAEVLRAMAGGKRPRRAVFILGYAGWGPGQLEAEMRRGGWETAPADEDLLFDADHRTKWERAMERRTRTL